MKINTTYLDPKILDDFLFSNSQSKILLEDILGGILPFPVMGTTGICIHGTYGTGKTTLAMCLPSLFELYGNLGEANRNSCFIRDPIYDMTACKGGAESASQVLDIAERVDSRVSYSQSGWHYELLDEVDLLAEKSQNALKSMMTFNKHTIFIMTTNNPSSLNRGVLDRCHLIELNAASTSSYISFGKSLLKRMNQSEDLLTDAELQAYGELCRGSLRVFGSAVLRSAGRK